MKLDKRIALQSFGILIVGVAIAILLYLLRPGVEKDEITIQPPGVDIFVVEMSDENLEVVTEGRVKSERSTVLRAEVSGVINKISKRFNNGGRIRKGEILYKIDDKELKVRKAEAEVQVAQAEIRLGKEEIESRLARERWKDSEEDVPPLALRKPYLREARANLKRAKANLRKAEYDLERTVARAPFNGTVRKRSVDIGSFVTKGTVVGEVYSRDNLIVELPIDRSELKLVDNPRPKSRHSTVILTDSVREEKSWNGKLVRIEDEVDPKTQQLILVAKLPRNSNLIPGVFLEAKISGKKLKNSIKIPVAALSGSGKVLVVTADNKIERRKVQLFSEYRGELLISSGLSSGEKIVRSYREELLDGTTVQIVTGES